MLNQCRPCALHCWRIDVGPTRFSPGQVQEAEAPFKIPYFPCQRDVTVLAAQRSVFGRVSRRLVEHQTQWSCKLRRENDRRSTQAELALYIIHIGGKLLTGQCLQAGPAPFIFDENVMRRT